jgi:multidrug efflux pump subunit AcrA (membrane-fusion protein)
LKELMDVLMIFAWIVFITMIAALLGILGFLGGWPGRIAKQRKAQYNLDQATVRAPADGFVTNIALRPGSRVLSFPVAPAMSFLESGELVVGTFIG